MIDAAKPHMSAGECNYAVVAVGAGDTFAAICQLLKLVAAKRIPLRPRLVKMCTTWIDAYVFHEEYDNLRGLIEGFLMPQSIRASIAIGRPPTSPRHGPFMLAKAIRTAAYGSCARQADTESGFETRRTDSNRFDRRCQ